MGGRDFTNAQFRYSGRTQFEHYALKIRATTIQAEIELPTLRPITDSPDDQLLFQIQGAIAEYERAKILECSRRGRLHRTRMGEINASKPPYGYWRTPKKYGGDGSIRIDEEEATMVRQIFAWYAEEGMPLYHLLQKLNASPWKTRARRKEWSATTVLRMLLCE